MSESFQTVIQIEASPEDVYEHFVDPRKLVSWMGDFARLEAVSGGLFSVDISGVLIRGHYVTLEKPSLIEVAWGEAGNDRMPPGSTQLRISLRARDTGTELTLVHSGLGPEEAKKHAIGWPHFLERLALAASGQDPGVDPWRKQPPAHHAGTNGAR